VWWPDGADGASGGFTHRALGGMRAASTRELPWSIPAVRLPDLPDTEPRWVWVRLAGDRSLTLAGGVSPLREQAVVQQELDYVDAAVAGMVLLMAVVSLMMGIALPDRRFIAYAGYLLTLALVFGSSEGLPASLWLQNHPLAAVRLHNFAVCLHSAAAFGFARVLLDMERQFPRMNRVFQVMTLVCLAACALAMAGWYGRIARPLNLMWVMFAACIVPMCAIALRRNLQAWPGLVGYAIYLLMGVVHFAKNLQWVPYTLATQSSYAVGSHRARAWPFFFALGWRVRHTASGGRSSLSQPAPRAAGAARERAHPRSAPGSCTKHQRTHDQLALALREQKRPAGHGVARVPHAAGHDRGRGADALADDRLGLVTRRGQDRGREDQRARSFAWATLVDTLLADEWLDASSENLCLVPVELAGVPPREDRGAQRRHRCAGGFRWRSRCARTAGAGGRDAAAHRAWTTC
jgi:hypothetical protein